MRDERSTLTRPDLGPASDEGQERAAEFVETTRMRVIACRAPVWRSPDEPLQQADELLFGEEVDALRFEGSLIFAQARRSGYVGWVPLGALSKECLSPTHWVSTLRTPALVRPTIRAALVGTLSMNALVTVERWENGYGLVQDLGWLPGQHLSSIGTGFLDPVRAASEFLGSPYIWGGRDSLGLDCSGLVQQAMFAAGMTCPRDADQQAVVGEPIGANDLSASDLVFWRGHVGMMVDGENMIHANAHHMAVAIEPLSEAITRIRTSSGEPSAYRRVQLAKI